MPSQVWRTLSYQHPDNIENDSNFVAKFLSRYLAEISTTQTFVSLPMWLSRDVIAPINDQKLLLKHITGVSDIAAEVVLRCQGKDVPDGEDYSDDLLFASPGGRMGAHAIYVILENIIRNSVKHGMTDVGERHVKVLVNVSDSTAEGLYEVMVWDTCGSANAMVEISDAGEKGQLPVYEYLNRVIHEAIIDDSGEVRPRNWGVREMMICAAYLRGVHLEDLEHLHDPFLFEIVPVNTIPSPFRRG